MDFGDILGSFWEAFGSILGSKSRSKFGVFFWTVFFAIPRRDVASTRLRRDFGATLTQVCAPRSPPGRRPFRARKDTITTPGTQTRDPTRPGPEARRINQHPDWLALLGYTRTCS